MPPWIRLGCCFWLGVLILGGAAGCVERRMIIATDPYGAIVYDEKNQHIGASPVDHPFTYNGVYRFRLAKDGYETLVVDEPVRAKWYELPVLDFISENLIPWTIRDVRYFHYSLQPVKVMPPDLLMKQAETLRDYGRTIGAPAPSNPPLMPPALDNNNAPTPLPPAP